MDFSDIALNESHLSYHVHITTKQIQTGRTGKNGATSYVQTARNLGIPVYHLLVNMLVTYLTWPAKIHV